MASQALNKATGDGGEGVMQALCAERGGQAREGHHKGRFVEADGKGVGRGAERWVKDTWCVWEYRGLSLAENPMKGVAIEQKVIPLSMWHKNHIIKIKFLKEEQRGKAPVPKQLLALLLATC